MTRSLPVALLAIALAIALGLIVVARVVGAQSQSLPERCTAAGACVPAEDTPYTVVRP